MCDQLQQYHKQDPANACRSAAQPAALESKQRPGGSDLKTACDPATDAAMARAALSWHLPRGAFWEPLGAGGQVKAQVRDLQVREQDPVVCPTATASRHHKQTVQARNCMAP